MTAARSINEPQRLAALERYRILDTTPEEAFDEIAQLAAAICGVPIALISLVDRSRQWFKSHIGLATAETPRDQSFCEYAIRESELFIVRDAVGDPRFTHNPLVVDEPHIRFYAAAQLVSPDGLNLGTLCVIDRQPRILDDVQCAALRGLARQVVVQLELRRQISERTAAEAALRRSNARTRSIIDNALGAIVTADDRGAIESVNPAAVRIFGYSAHELIGRDLSMLFDDERELSRFLDDSVGRVTAPRGRRRNGETFTCELSLFEFSGDDRRHFAAHLLDVSEREEVDRLKRDFVSTVSHELRTPLTSIRGALGLLSSGVAGELPPESRQLVNVAERNSVRLITLINDILDIEKLERGEIRMERRPTWLQSVFERSVATLSAYAEQEGVTIEAERTDACVIGDEGRLGQVLVNLLSNAVKYSHRGSSVKLSARGADERNVDIVVTDRGRGIAPAARQKIFERFHQVESSDSRTKPGTGLGLAICKAIVEQHGGTISVESREGEGSTFSFRLEACP